MRRDGIDYMRCLDCDQVFESEDLEQIPAFDEADEEPRRKNEKAAVCALHVRAGYDGQYGIRP